MEELYREFPDKRDTTEKNGKKEVNFAGRRILLVEDHPLNAMVTTRLLEKRGMEVVHAENGEEAVDCFAQSAPGYFDAILMDIRMPVMDGLEATRQIRTSGKPDSRTIPIIALTANAFDEDTKKSMESGMDGHLSKPIQVGLMMELLGKCIGRHAAKNME